MLLTLLAAARALVFTLWTLCLISMMFLVRVAGTTGLRNWSRLQSLFRIWACGALRIMNVRLAVQGRAPDAPCLLTTNHLGYLDIVILAATMEATFVSKLDVARWPLLGPVVTLLGTIYVDRTRPRDVSRVNDLIHATLRQGRSVIVFPEGTSSDGRDVLPLRPSLLRAAQDGEFALHYARLAYQTCEGAPDAASAVCWWGDADFLPHAWGLFHVPRTQALIHFGPEAVASKHRKELALELHERIRALPASLP